jgi:hypothetical protein
MLHNPPAPTQQPARAPARVTVLDWARSAADLILAPVVLGALAAALWGVWWGLAVFAYIAVVGAFVVHARFVRCPHPDKPWEWGNCRAPSCGAVVAVRDGEAPDGC